MKLSSLQWLRLLASLLLPLLLLAGFILTDEPSGFVAGFTIVLVLVTLIVYQFDYFNPVTAYLFPWLLILLMVTLELSSYSRTLDSRTYLLILVPFVLWFIAGTALPARGPRPNSTNFQASFRKNGYGFYLVCFVLMVVTTVLTIDASGYIPLLRGLQTGKTNYLSFGIPGIHGLYLAFMTAFAVFSFYLYLIRKKPFFLSSYLFTGAVFILFVTRQNLIALLVSTVILYSFIRRKLNGLQLLLIFITVISLFAVVGEFRSGDIRELIGLLPSYSWLPDSLVWLYAYGFFNILNLDNLIIQSPPRFNGSAFSNLLPSPLRPSFSHDNFLELSNFTVSSYLFPLYQDLGFYGTTVLSLLFLCLGSHFYRRTRAQQSFFYLASYATLYFCGLFSFFVNYWFYLPIIFQIVFFFLFSKLILKRPSWKGKS
jgi:oligosaccharide repeat unit polymerase